MLINEIVRIIPHPETKPTEKDMSKIRTIVEIRGVLPDAGEEELFPYGLTPEEKTIDASLVRSALNAWLANGGVIPEWVPPTTEELREQMEPINPRQLRHGLLSIEVFEEEIDAIIQAMPNELERRRAYIDWRKAEKYERLHPLVVSIGDAIGLTPEHIDSLWGYFLTI